jgi:hypothetical protein
MPFIMPSQAQANVTHNEALIRLDGCVQLSAIDRTHTAPPVSPAEGDRYLVADAATGAFAGHDGEIAYFADGAWLFLVPREGWLCWLDDEARLLVRHAGGWQVMAGDGAELVPLMGVNTAADTTNRLIVRSAAALFTHDGAGHQLKLNKAAAADTASLLFQTAFSGRAEIGLVGDDDFVFKVSPDGSSFLEAIRIDRSSGSVIANTRPPTVQTFTANGTWTRPDGCRTVVIEGVGGGGGGGGADGQGAGTYAAACGGGAGASGRTGPVDVTGIGSATIVIGAAGAGGAAGNNNGTGGGTTSWSDGTNSFSWGGGAGGEGATATSSPRCRRGGSTPYGTGGGGVQSTIGSPVNGIAASGYGSGGGGGAAHQTSSDAGGGSGTSGFVQVWEYY